MWARRTAAAAARGSAARRTLFTDKLDTGAAANAADATGNLFRNMAIFVAFPGCLLLAVRIINAEHKGTVDGKDWSHLNINRKKFPWGDGSQSLFYNPTTQGGEPKATRTTATGLTAWIASQMPSTEHVAKVNAALVTQQREVANGAVTRMRNPDHFHVDPALISVVGDPTFPSMQ